jgi:hypothetical protein
VLFASAFLFGALAIWPVVAADEAASSEVERAASTPTEIAGWIDELDDNRYLVRERATQQLLDAGSAALDPLLAAANGDRLEPADRAVWILRRHSRASDSSLAIDSLERLVKLRGRPVLVEKAELQLAQRSVDACKEQLSPLGAEVLVQPTQFDIANVVPLLHIRLGEKWQGTTEDLRCVAKLRHQLHYRLDGAAINDDVALLFEEKEKLAFLQLYHTKVTPDAVDALKKRHPDAIVYVRGQALLGVQAENHPAGVLVQRVEDGTAAATAGIVPGDVIASIDGHSLPDFDRLTARIAQHRPGETIDVEIVRAEERKKLTVTLGRWPGQE